jgi:signal transduction histidine kinase/DNA-binding response OmpR family regulator
MKFGIGTKISLLTCILVLATAYPLSMWVLKTSVKHVIRHEIVDLVDETNESTLQILRSVGRLRGRTAELAAVISRESVDEAVKAGIDSSLALAELRPKLEEQLRSDLDLLQFEILPFFGNDKTTGDPVLQHKRSTVAAVSTFTGQADFIRTLIDDGGHEAQVSSIGQSFVVYRKEQGEGVIEDGPKLVLQAGAIITGRNDDKIGDAQKGYVLLATSHCRLLDSDHSRSDQISTSPRHFLFAVDSNERILQHPDPSRISDLPRHESRTLAEEDDAIRSQFEALRSFIATVDAELHEHDELLRSESSLERVQELLIAIQDDRQAREFGKTLENGSLGQIQAWFGFSDELPGNGEIVGFFEPDPTDKSVDHEDARDKVEKWKAEFFTYLRQHPEYQVSLPTRTIPRLKIRCLTGSASDLVPLQREIEERIKGLGITARLRWRAPVKLETFTSQLVRLQFEPRHPERFLDIAVCVSNEEIASDVETEVDAIKWTALGMAAAAGGLAVLFSLVITRPLKKIISSTKRLIKGNYNLGELPVNDRGEIGVLARSFADMVEQLNERRRAVQEEQVKIQELNNALKRERDSLDVRVRARTAELKTTNTQLESARDAALEASRAKSAFLAQMSHELRTPLNAIIGYGELLIEEMPGSNEARFIPDLNRIVESGRHLLGLINDILDLSKIEAGKMELFVESFEVKQLVESVVGTIDPLARKSGNRLMWSCPAEIQPLCADRTRVRQVLLNLLGNSLKFTENGEIHLTVANESEGDRAYVVFRVRDTGVGMTSEQMQRLFKRFSQVDSSLTRRYQGTGLGLAICKRFCEMMGGDISVVSEFGKGSVFTVRLPVTPPATVISEVVPWPGTKSWSGFLGGKVVVIDDDPSARDLLQRYLSREGFDVATAAGGEEGVRLVRELQPAFITLDVMMPNMDGWEVLTALKADPQLREIPVIMVTMTNDRNLGFALGATDFMTKPIDKERLIGLARRFRNDTTTDQSILVVEDDEPTRSLMVRMLQGAGWSVHTAENGRLALQKLAECRPSLILLDLMMPEMDGFAFVAELRKLPEWKAIPIVIVTAKELTPDERNRLNGSVRQILQKGSYGREELLEQVRKLLKSRSVREQNELA